MLSFLHNHYEISDAFINRDISYFPDCLNTVVYRVTQIKYIIFVHYTDNIGLLGEQ